MSRTSQGLSINRSSATRLSPFTLKKFSMAAAGEKLVAEDMVLAGRFSSSLAASSSSAVFVSSQLECVALLSSFALGLH